MAKPKAKQKRNPPCNILLIGCGGIGGWVFKALEKSLPDGSKLMLVDGDIVTETNLDRQLFDSFAIGKAKVLAMAESAKFSNDVQVEVAPVMFTPDTCKSILREYLTPATVLLVCPDQHQPRRLALDVVDAKRANVAIIGGNETITASAFAYQRSMRRTELDPRVYHPELAVDSVPEMSCIAAQHATPQLAIANMLAASYMMLLWHIYSQEGEVGRMVEIANTSGAICTKRRAIS